jgi:hypothetical protein
MSDLNATITKNKDELKKIKIDRGEYYTGIFQDGHGSPDFKGLGPISKGLLYLFLFSIILSNCNIYFIIPLFIFFIGRILTAIRFYYVETLDPTGNDIYFIRMNILQNFIEGFVALFVLLYLLLHNIFTKKNK